MNPVRSPCINVCRLDARDVCVGCRRTRAEIAAWRDMSDAQRQRVLERLRQLPQHAF